MKTRAFTVVLLDDGFDSYVLLDHGMGANLTMSVRYSDITATADGAVIRSPPLTAVGYDVEMRCPNGTMLRSSDLSYVTELVREKMNAMNTPFPEPLPTPPLPRSDSDCPECGHDRSVHLAYGCNADDCVCLLVHADKMEGP